MQVLRIMSHRREEKIVCVGDGAADGMGDGVANSPLVEISAAHDAASRTTRARSIPSVTCAPSTTFNSATIPLKGATRLCSIFMASSVTSFWPFVTRSEELRVGKECGSTWCSRGLPYHEKKKQN